MFSWMVKPTVLLNIMQIKLKGLFLYLDHPCVLNIASSFWSPPLTLLVNILFIWGFPDSSAGKESACNAGDPLLSLCLSIFHLFKIPFKLHLLQEPCSLANRWKLSFPPQHPYNSQCTLSLFLFSVATEWKQSHHFADKGPSSQSYGFPSSHVWMWQLDHKEG